MKRITRYIQSIRIYCPVCKKYVTPDSIVINNDEGHTVAFEFECDNKHPRNVIAEFSSAEKPGKD